MNKAPLLLILVSPLAFAAGAASHGGGGAASSGGAHSAAGGAGHSSSGAAGRVSAAIGAHIAAQRQAATVVPKPGPAPRPKPKPVTTPVPSARRDETSIVPYRVAPAVCTEEQRRRNECPQDSALRH